MPLEIASLIQVAVAPIFLLVGAGSFLNVMTVRLGRVVDRARILESTLPGETDPNVRARNLRELKALDFRLTHVNRAIAACVIAALLVCLTVALLFTGPLVATSLDAAIASLFVLAMLSLIAGLIDFLREVSLAGRQLRVRAEFLGERDDE